MLINKSLEDVENNFKSSIKIPKSIPKKQFFFCPIGLVGAGKTTITKPISERFGLIRLSSDELRKILKENGYDYSSIKKIGFKLAYEFADTGFSISFDMDCGNPETKNFVEDLAQERQAKIVWVHVDTPEEYIFEKFRKHPPSWLADNPEIMINNYYAQKETRIKENTKFDYIFTFDTSKPDLVQQIDDCISKIALFTGNS